MRDVLVESDQLVLKPSFGVLAAGQNLLSILLSHDRVAVNDVVRDPGRQLLIHSLRPLEQIEIVPSNVAPPAQAGRVRRHLALIVA